MSYSNVNSSPLVELGASSVEAERCLELAAGNIDIAAELFLSGSFAEPMCDHLSSGSIVRPENGNNHAEIALDSDVQHANYLQPCDLPDNPDNDALRSATLSAHFPPPPLGFFEGWLQNFGRTMFGLDCSAFDAWFEKYFHETLTAYETESGGDSRRGRFVELEWVKAHELAKRCCRWMLLWVQASEPEQRTPGDETEEGLESAVQKNLVKFLCNPHVVDEIERRMILIGLDALNVEHQQICERLGLGPAPRSCLVLAQALQTGGVEGAQEWPLGHYFRAVDLPGNPILGINLQANEFLMQLSQLDRLGLNPSCTSSRVQLERRAREAARSQNDRNIREAQDREFQEALQMDQLREQSFTSYELDRHINKCPSSTSGVEPEGEEDTKEPFFSTAELEDLLPLFLSVGHKSPESVTKIQVRFPSGKRRQQTFSRDAPVKQLFQWVCCLPTLERLRGEPDPLSEDEVPRRFELSPSFPPSSLSSDWNSSFAEAGLAPSCVVLLKDGE